MEVRAYGKVNLCLEVLRRRSDGYHEVSTVLQAISLCDELTIEEARGLTLECSVSSIPQEDNLAYQAAFLLRHETRTRQGAHIRLRKQIPIGAGLGGGSADAAAVLIALNRLWRLELTAEQLAQMGARLGSDVPFFLNSSGTALATGRGEKVTPLPSPAAAWILALFPPIEMERKTETLYGMLSKAHYSDGTWSRRWEERLRARAAWHELLRDPGVHNVFEDVALQAFPGIQGPWQEFISQVGSGDVRLAGSGPAIFSILEGPGLAEVAARRLREKGHRVLVAVPAPWPIEVL